MSTLTIPFADDDDLQFLRTWSASQGLTPEAFLAKQTHLLRERLQKPLHPDVIAISGIIKGDVDTPSRTRHPDLQAITGLIKGDFDEDAVRLEHLLAKHS